jgi:inositol oxygenase
MADLLAHPPKKHFEPVKEKSQFRVYEKENSRFDAVCNTYKEMHENQTVEYVRDQHRKWLKFDHAKIPILEALDMLNDLVDDSDPDIDLPNSVHAYQTAERIRKLHPNEDWMHLTALIHDIGKIMPIWGQPQWATVGDTFPVGCGPDPVIVHVDSFNGNPDMKNEQYNSKLGMYKENCGLEQVLMSWSHDEYMFRVLEHNKCTIPKEGMYIIRYHSFYPWHTGKAYDYLCNDQDRNMLPWIKEFNKFDLYSKSDDVPNPKTLKAYYQTLVDKYCPGELEW